MWGNEDGASTRRRAKKNAPKQLYPDQDQARGPRQDEARQLAPRAANSSQGSSARIYHQEGKLGITVLPRKSSKREPASNPSHPVTGIKRFVCRELTSASSSSLLSSRIVRRTLLDDMVDSISRRVHTSTHKRHTNAMCMWWVKTHNTQLRNQSPVSGHVKGRGGGAKGAFFSEGEARQNKTHAWLTMASAGRMIARLGASARRPVALSSAGARRSASNLKPVDQVCVCLFAFSRLHCRLPCFSADFSCVCLCIDRLILAHR